MEVLRTMESDSVDALVTDPPAGISFMGKAWDGDKGGRGGWVKWLGEVMRECLRVMKPGAHGLVWALPRTSHWTATALEDAGFEIRDVVIHLFGSGFPKSLDVSKQLDKMAGAEREVVGKDLSKWRDASNHEGGKYSKMRQSDFETKCTITAPATDAAKQWQGFGTALKPASEHWILIRKPCSEKTVAANVLKWGTGALNIDGSRIASGGEHMRGHVLSNRSTSVYGKMTEFKPTDSPLGRFPSHLLLSCACPDPVQHELGCAVRELDEQTGGRTIKTDCGNALFKRNVDTIIPDDIGIGASRFFYCAKVSSSERNASGENKHPTVKPQKLMRYICRLITPPGGTILDPFMGSGSTGCAALEERFKFIGIEQDEDYHFIAKLRLKHAAELTQALHAEATQ